MTPHLNAQKSIERHPVEGRDWAFVLVASPAPAFAGVTVKMGSLIETCYTGQWWKNVVSYQEIEIVFK